MLSIKKGVGKMTKCLLLFSCVFAIASSAFAQTKFSGTMECGKANSIYTIQIPEQKGSSYAITEGKCTWTKPFTAAGIEPRQNAGVDFTETRGDSVKGNSAAVTYYKNGDEMFHKGTFTFDPKTMISSGTWTFIGGTGKFQGIKGGGTSSCKSKSAEPDAESTCEIKGEYTLPAANK
jgi:hypothetical protein